PATVDVKLVGMNGDVTRGPAVVGGERAGADAGEEIRRTAGDGKTFRRDGDPSAAAGAADIGRNLCSVDQLSFIGRDGYVARFSGPASRFGEDTALLRPMTACKNHRASADRDISTLGREGLKNEPGG